MTAAAGALCWGWGGTWPDGGLVIAAAVLAVPWHILAKCPVFWHLLHVALKAVQESARFWLVWGASPHCEHLFSLVTGPICLLDPAAWSPDLPGLSFLYEDFLKLPTLALIPIRPLSSAVQ